MQFTSVWDVCIEMETEIEEGKLKIFICLSQLQDKEPAWWNKFMHYYYQRKWRKECVFTAEGALSTTIAKDFFCVQQLFFHSDYW